MGLACFVYLGPGTWFDGEIILVFSIFLVFVCFCFHTRVSFYEDYCMGLNCLVLVVIFTIAWLRARIRIYREVFQVRK